MKCCKCNKELDVKVSEIPPKWFGMYTMGELFKAICAECIKKPENKSWGSSDFD